jgi:hypothetical protein
MMSNGLFYNSMDDSIANGLRFSVNNGYRMFPDYRLNCHI